MTKETLKKLNEISLKFEDISEFMVSGRKSLTLITETSAFLNIDIPNKANTREFTGNKNKSVKEMITTLKTEPEMFRFKNLGLRLVASDYIRKDNEIVLFFDEDEGIFNGGHTYRVLKTHGRESAYVNVMIDLGLPKEKLAEISVALNMSKKIEQISVGEKKGEFEWIKQALSDNEIAYKEGDSGKYLISDVLKVASIFKTSHGKNWSKVGLPQALRQQGEILKENSENKALEYTKYILSDMWEVYKSIRNNEVIMNNFSCKKSRGKDLGQGYTLVMMAGVRSMIEINKNSIPVWKSGYNKEIAIELSEKVSKKIGKELSKKTYKDVAPETIGRDSNFHQFVELEFLKNM